MRHGQSTSNALCCFAVRVQFGEVNMSVGDLLKYERQYRSVLCWSSEVVRLERCAEVACQVTTEESATEISKKIHATVGHPVS